LRESNSITYLENESRLIYLRSPTGPGTHFKVFGSPCTPGPRKWAFEYEEKDAGRLWNKIPEDVDVVVTHTPPKGHCDGAIKDDRSGCSTLLQRLAQVRPLLHTCGHIHEARGIERIHWSPFRSDSLVDNVDYWKDPGSGNRKLSLLDLTSKSGRPLCNSAGRTRQSVPDALQCGVGDQPGLSLSGYKALQPDQGNLNPTSSLIRGALQESEALGRIEHSGAMKRRGSIQHESPCKAALDGTESRSQGHEHRAETVVINAAFLGPRINGKTIQTNKPIVVDIDLPVCKAEGDGNV
jgi:hypothetical protein